MMLIESRRFAACALLAVLGACADVTPDDGTAQDSAVTGNTAATAPGDSLPADVPDAASDPAAELAITSDGVGRARRGMSLGELRSVLPPSHVVGAPDDAFMVDIVAIPVTTAGDTLYRLIFPAGEPISDAAFPHLVMTMHLRARTEDGVGPGTTLSDAAQIYGEPTLSYSIYDESREYAEFPRQPEHITFRVQPAVDAMFAGNYTTSDEYNTTDEYDRDAQIWMVFVDLRTN